MSVSSMFQPLDATKPEIQLLDILPSKDFESQILCCLRKVSLDDPIEFNALSWCWGLAPKSSIIKINHQDFQCSPNLEAALRSFRHPNITQTFWVDATCINQHDLQEKSKQIPLMSRIYTEAGSVIVWLGESTKGSNDAVQIIRELQKKPSFTGCKVYGAPLKEEMIESLCELFHRPWWERIWVMQEVALARRAVFYCGKDSFECVGFEELASGMYEFVTGKHPFSHMHPDIIPDLTDKLFQALRKMTPVIDMIKMARQIQAKDSPRALVVKAIIRVSILKATDPRDKVYGCLGMLPGFSQLLVPNYENIPDVVYSVATWALIVYARTFFPLCFVRSRRTVEAQGEKFTFPSWSLNFAENASKRWDLFNMFSCTGTWGPFETKLRFPYLETAAVLFDEIVSCHSMSPDWEMGSSVKISRNMHSTWRAFFGLELDRSDHSAYTGGNSVENAYWRLIVFDTRHGIGIHDGAERYRMEAARIKSFVEWVRDPNSHGLKPGYPDWEKNKDAMHYHFALNEASYKQNTCLFKTRKGYIGMSTGIPDLKVGDQVYFLDRGEVPWALRPVKDKTEETVFEVISECYVHGVMDGEAFKPSPQPDSKAWKRHELRRKLFGGQILNEEFPLPPWNKILLT